jgi:hypothetical protein
LIFFKNLIVLLQSSYSSIIFKYSPESQKKIIENFFQVFQILNIFFKNLAKFSNSSQFLKFFKYHDILQLLAEKSRPILTFCLGLVKEKRKNGRDMKFGPFQLYLSFRTILSIHVLKVNLKKLEMWLIGLMTLDHISRECRRLKDERIVNL